MNNQCVSFSNPPHPNPLPEGEGAKWDSSGPGPTETRLPSWRRQQAVLGFVPHPNLHFDICLGPLTFTAR